MKRFVVGCGILVITALGTVAIAQQEPGQDAPAREGEARPDRPERRGGMQRPDMLMVLLDKDRDGSLSTDEINGSSDVLRALDKNEDGSVTAEELRPRRERSRDGQDRAEGDGERRNRRGGMGGFIMRYDSNSDGEVTREEYAAGMDEQFNRFDANHDGKIDAEEAANAMPGRPDGERPNRREGRRGDGDSGR